MGRSVAWIRVRASATWIPHWYIFMNFVESVASTNVRVEGWVFKIFFLFKETLWKLNGFPCFMLYGGSLSMCIYKVWRKCRTCTLENFSHVSCLVKSSWLSKWNLRNSNSPLFFWDRLIYLTANMEIRYCIWDVKYEHWISFSGSPIRTFLGCFLAKIPEGLVTKKYNCSIWKKYRRLYDVNQKSSTIHFYTYTFQIFIRQVIK